MAVLVYKSLHGLAVPILGWRPWTRRSCRPSSAAIAGHCHVCYHHVRYSTRLGDRAFPVAGPLLWISLRSNLR